MYRIAACDDDQAFLHQLQQMVDHIMTENSFVHGKDYEIDLFQDAIALKEAVFNANPSYHLLLLDIELNQENGLNVAQLLRKHQINSSIVFISAYRDYVFDCFHSQPLWYLLKPLDYEKFKNILLTDIHRNYINTHLTLKIEGRQVLIPFSDIYALESFQHHTRIWLHDGYRSWNGALSALKPLLPSHCFCQSHNSYIINLSHVKEIQRTDALMDDGRLFPISRRFYNHIFEHYFAYLKI